MKAEIYKFADFELDSAKRALLKNGNSVSLNPKAFDLLVCLVENQGEIVSKDDLINIVWEGQFVEENNITVQISALRKVLGDNAKSAKFLKTIPGKGYKFIADVDLSDGEEVVYERHSLSRLVLEEEIDEDEEAIETPQISEKQSAKKNSRLPLFTIFLIGLIFLITGILIFNFGGNRENTTKYRLVKTDKLTTSGKITNLALTPNGEYAVLSQKEGEGESLWLRHLVTGGQQQLIAPQPAKFVGLTVSPDGNFIYFSRFGNEAETFLERIPILGGVPEKFQKVDSAVSTTFSPDGKRIAFTQSHTAAGMTSLSVADFDGSNKRTLISAKNDERILATYDANPITWSPAGDLIAVAVEEKLSKGSSEMAIILVNSQDGSEKEITEKRWKHAMELTWVDRNNLAFYGFDEGEKRGDIWIVSAKTGESYRLTNDSNFYQKLSGGNGKLIAIEGNEISRIKYADFAKDFADFDIKEVFNETGFISDADWSKEEDSIIYPSGASGKREIWQIGIDGKNPKQLTVNAEVSGWLSVSPKNGSIIFSADKDGFSALWLTDRNGKNLLQLTSKNKDARPNFLPDGESVIFQRGTTFGKQMLWKLNVNDKTLKQITKTHTSHPQISPDGKLTAYYFMDNETDKRWRIGIVENETGEIKGKISFPVVVNHRRMRWHPKNDFITQVFYEGEDAKLLFLPVKGGEHKILSGFGKGEIISLDWSDDGEKLLFSQINEIRDVVKFDIAPQN